MKCLIGWLTNLALESKLPAEKLTTWDMQMAHFNGRKWIGTKEPLNGGERGEWKSWLNENTAPCPITSWQIEERKVETLTDFYFLWLQNRCRLWLQPWNLKVITPWKESHDKVKQHLKSRHHFADKDPYSQSYGFSGSHVRMWELDHEEGWVSKSWCFWIVLEKTVKSLGLQRD